MTVLIGTPAATGALDLASNLAGDLDADRGAFAKANAGDRARALADVLDIECLDRIRRNLILIPDAWQVADLGGRVGDSVLDAAVVSWGSSKRG